MGSSFGQSFSDWSAQPANDAERKAIGFLRDHLPDDWLIFHNFEICKGAEVFEIDIACLLSRLSRWVRVATSMRTVPPPRPTAIPLTTCQATQPREGHGDPYQRALSQAELRKAHVHAAVLLTADDAAISDPAGIDAPHVRASNGVS